MAKGPEFTRREKVSVRQLNLSQEKVGFTFRGVFIGYTTRPWVDPNGVEKDMLIGHWLDAGSNFERVQFPVDAGLKTALEQAFGQTGDFFEIIKLDKINLKGGQTMNQYDIYALEAGEISDHVKRARELGDRLIRSRDNTPTVGRGTGAEDNDLPGVTLPRRPAASHGAPVATQ